MMRIRLALSQFDIQHLAGLALWFALLAAVLAIPRQILDFALPVIPRARMAITPTIQTRASLGDVPYQLLRDVHTVLPFDARILLVTDGTDVRHHEYTTFHRALYYLLPRPVWWLSPAPNDGTWEARWWHSAPLTESAILEFAQSKNVDFMLLLTNQDLFPSKRTLARWDGAKLVSVNDRVVVTAPTSAPEFAPPDWHWRVLAALALFFLNGTFVLEILARGRLVLYRIEWFALSWSLGVGFVTFLCLSTLALGLSLALSVELATLTAILGAILLIVRWFRPQKRNPAPIFRDVGFAAAIRSLPFLLILFLQTGYVSFVALGQPLPFWDSWVTWSAKARALYLEQIISPAFLTDTSRAVTHLDYPLLLPLAQAALYQFLDAPDDRFVGWIALSFFLALVALVYSAVRTFGASPLRALLAATVVGALPTLALLAAQNYADIPLAVYAIVTATYLLRWIRRGERGAFAISVLGAACLAWIKNEGFVLALAIALAALLLWPRAARARRGAFGCALASGLVAFSWSLGLAARGTSNTDFMPLTLATLIRNLDRIPTILLYFQGNLVSTEWAFVWISAALLLLARFVRRADSSHDLYLVAALLYLVTLSVTYIFSDYAPYTAHLASSGYRLVAQVTPCIVIWVGLQKSRPQSVPEINHPLAASTRD